MESSHLDDDVEDGRPTPQPPTTSPPPEVSSAVSEFGASPEEPTPQPPTTSPPPPQEIRSAVNEYGAPNEEPTPQPSTTSPPPPQEINSAVNEYGAPNEEAGLQRSVTSLELAGSGNYDQDSTGSSSGQLLRYPRTMQTEEQTANEEPALGLVAIPMDIYVCDKKQDRSAEGVAQKNTREHKEGRVKAWISDVSQALQRKIEHALPTTFQQPVSEFPKHWKCGAIDRSVTKLYTYIMRDVDTKERVEIESLFQKTWEVKFVDSSIQFERISRVENFALYKKYCEEKNIFKEQHVDQLRKDGEGSNEMNVPHVQDPRGGSGMSSNDPFLTTTCMDPNGLLYNEIDKQINECYLFHKTSSDKVEHIARNGLDKRQGSLGKGIYLTESSATTDQDTDTIGDGERDNETKHYVFLLRALLGHPHLNTEKIRQPPCTTCTKIPCCCMEATHYDSIVDDSESPSRVFVVFKESQCYPEYFVTYRIGTGGSAAITSPATTSATFGQCNRVHPEQSVPAFETQATTLALLPPLTPPLTTGPAEALQLYVPLPPEPLVQGSSFAAEVNKEKNEEFSGTECFKILLRTIVVILGLGIMMAAEAIPAAMMIHGRLHIEDCPGLPLLYPYLQAMGISGFTLCLIVPIIAIDDTGTFSHRTIRVIFVLLVVLPCVGFQMWGYIYLNGPGNRDSISTTNDTLNNYCSEPLIQFSMWSTRYITLSYALCPFFGFLIWWIDPEILSGIMIGFTAVTVLVCVALFLLALLLPFLFLGVGALFIHDCPRTPLLPIFLLLTAFPLFFLVYFVVCLGDELVCCCDWPKTIKVAFVSLIVAVVQHSFQWACYLHTYPYQGSQISQDPSSSDYCHRDLYEFAYTTLPFATLLDFLVPFVYYVINLPPQSAV